MSTFQHCPALTQIWKCEHFKIAQHWKMLKCCNFSITRHWRSIGNVSISTPPTLGKCWNVNIPAFHEGEKCWNVNTPNAEPMLRNAGLLTFQHSPLLKNVEMSRHGEWWVNAGQCWDLNISTFSTAENVDMLAFASDESMLGNGEMRRSGQFYCWATFRKLPWHAFSQRCQW